NDLDAPRHIGRWLERRACLLGGDAGDVRSVTFLTVLFEQLRAARRLLLIDRAEDRFGPARRGELLQRELDAMQVRDAHRAAETLARRQLASRCADPPRHRADTERFADVARERLGNRAVVLHP